MQIELENADFNNFSEERYLKANQDISDAVQKGLYTNGLEHFTKFGHKENRKLWPRIDIEITDLRKNIIRRVGENLEEFGNRSFIHTEAKMFLPLTAGLISNNNYDAEVLDLFSDKNKLFVDIGAGWRDCIRENVINVEIYDYPSTDVIAFAEKLPFLDNSFDGAVCLAVLEHVQDPFKAASELLRIVKPNGILIVDWPFLQPEHGYPHHYFNATREGARITFTRLSEDIEVDVSVPIHMHPMATYRWFLESWLKGLESKLSKLIFLITPPLVYLRKPWNEQLSKKVSQLSQAQQPIIASGFRIKVKNKK